jgi:hypothetical protein
MGLDRDGPVIDVCRLCGLTKALTFEHVPPRAAFNKFPRFYPPAQEVLARETQGTPLSGNVTLEPRGAGAYTLCADCNGRCSRYAQHFIEWAIAWSEAMDAQSTGNLVTLSRRIRRGRIMKQILAMFLSANPPDFGRINSEVRRYVKNAEETGLPPKLRIFAGLTRTLDARQAGITGFIGGDGRRATFSEIAFAPFVFMMTVSSTPPDERLVEITFLAQSGWNERQDTTLTLPVVEFSSAVPGLYTPW